MIGDAKIRELTKSVHHYRVVVAVLLVLLSISVIHSFWVQSAYDAALSKVTLTNQLSAELASAEVAHLQQLLSICELRHTAAVDSFNVELSRLYNRVATVEAIVGFRN